MSNSAFQQRQTGNASEAGAGSVQKATPAEVAAGTDVGSSGAPLFVVPSLLTSINVQEFTASGTWTKPSTGNFALVECWGGGGSGGVSRNSSNATNNCASGGGGGEYVAMFIPLALLSNTVAVAIGLGGASVSLGSNGPNPGMNGSATTFGVDIVIANPGLRGVGSTTNAGSAAGGIGGSSKHIDKLAEGGRAYGATNLTGVDGQSTYVSAAGGGAAWHATTGVGSSSNGGISEYGGDGGDGVRVSGGDATGEDGSVPGGGGGAAVAVNGVTRVATSGKGGDGFCRVTVF